MVSIKTCVNFQNIVLSVPLLELNRFLLSLFRKRQLSSSELVKRIAYASVIIDSFMKWITLKKPSPYLMCATAKTYTAGCKS